MGLPSQVISKKTSRDVDVKFFKLHFGHSSWSLRTYPQSEPDKIHNYPAAHEDQNLRANGKDDLVNRIGELDKEVKQGAIFLTTTCEGVY